MNSAPYRQILGQPYPEPPIIATMSPPPLSRTTAACASALKRKYYMLARQDHPDKGGKFKRVGEVMDVRRVPDRNRSKG